MLSMTAPQANAPRPLPLAAELDPVAAAGIRVNVTRDAALFWEGEEAGACYKILSGAIRTVKMMSDGRRHVGDFFLPGDLVGIEAGDLRTFCAEAIVDAVVVKFPRRALERRIEDSPRLGRALLALASERLNAAQSRMLLLGRKSANERMASFLLGMSERARGADEFDLPMTRADIADYLGLTVETVSRCFAKLKQSRLVALKGPQHVVILDRDGLEELSEGDAE